MDLVALENYFIDQGKNKNTVNNYMVVARVVARTISEFNEDTVVEFVHQLKRDVLDKKRSPSSVNKYTKIIRHYCRLNKIEPYPCTKRMREDHQPRILFSDSQIESFLNLPPSQGDDVKTFNRYTIFWHFSCYTSMRPVEILQLTQDCVDEYTIIIRSRNSKTKKGRVIGMPPIIKDKVLEYTNNCPTELLFPSSWNKDRPLNHAAVTKDFKKRLVRLGITKPVKPYSFRHSFITRNLRKNKNSLYTVQDIAGHSNANVTKTYFHGDLELQKEVYENDPLSFDHLAPPRQLELFISDIEDLVKHKKGKLLVDLRKNEKCLTLKVAVDDCLV